MKNDDNIELDFIVDKLTNSIQNVKTGDSFQTEVLRLRKTDLKSITKSKWNFNWKAELENNKKEVFKLTIINNADIIQGLLSLSIEQDHIYVSLLESAPFNIGKTKVYEGVAGNLIAYACKLSFQQNFEGFIAFTAKTQLIEHYENTLGAFRISGQKMAIPTKSAKILVDKYFKE